MFEVVQNFMRNNYNAKYPHHEFLYKMVVDKSVDTIEEAVQRLFFALGFKNKLSGTLFLKEAIVIWCSIPNSKRVMLTSDIYPTVAVTFNSTPWRVERAIRNTLIDCHRNGRLIYLNDLALSDVVSTAYVPTNGEFLSVVVAWLRLHFRNRYRQLSFL